MVNVGNDAFAVIVLDAIMENPFVFDLIKSETYDWEENDLMYSKSIYFTNPVIGYLSGFISEYVAINSKISHNCN